MGSYHSEKVLFLRNASEVDYLKIKAALPMSLSLCINSMV